MVFHPTPMMLAEPNKYVINNFKSLHEKKRERKASQYSGAEEMQHPQPFIKKGQH